MRIRWANLLLFLASAASVMWVLTHKRVVSELHEHLTMWFEINEQWKPVIEALGIAVVIALVVRILREPRSGGGR